MLLKPKPLRLRSLSVSFMLSVGIVSTGCSVFQGKPESSSDDAMIELTKSLQQSAQKVAQARVELARMQPVGKDGQTTDGQPSPMKHASTLVDIDYVGPVENALNIVTASLGWNLQVSGKKRAETIVSLRHKDTDALVILRDIGIQCGSKCNVHANIREGGQSSISLEFQD